MTNSNGVSIQFPNIFLRAARRQGVHVGCLFPGEILIHVDQVSP